MNDSLLKKNQSNSFYVIYLVRVTSLCRYYLREDAEDAMRCINGTRLDDRIIRTDWDAGFVEGRQYGRGKHGGQVMVFWFFPILTLTFLFLISVHDSLAQVHPRILNEAVIFLKYCYYSLFVFLFSTIMKYFKTCTNHIASRLIIGS